MNPSRTGRPARGSFHFFHFVHSRTAEPRKLAKLAVQARVCAKGETQQTQRPYARARARSGGG